MTRPDCPASEFATAANSTFRIRPSFGFVCLHPLDVPRILLAARALENGCIIIGHRKRRHFGPADSIFEFDESIFTDAKVPVVVWCEERLLDFDGFFEVIACQAPFPQMKNFKDSRIALIPKEVDGLAINEFLKS